MRDKHNRSILKAISWRVVGSIDTILISYFITGSFKLAFSIGFVETFTKITIYYLHERLWEKIDFGKKLKSVPTLYKNNIGEEAYD